MIDLKSEQTTDAIIAFNAALTLFAIALIFSSTADTEVTFEAHISRGQEYLVKATAALKALDRDNDIVSKCEQYVEYLSQSLDRCRKCLRQQPLHQQHTDPRHV